MTLIPLASIGPSPWKTSGSYDFVQFLSAVSYLLTTDSILYFEGVSISKDVMKFFETNKVSPRVRIESGTLFPKPSMFHLPYNSESVDQLRALSRVHAQPELFDHLMAYEDNSIILAAHDFGGNGPIYISESRSEQSVQAFAYALGCKLIKSR